MQTEIRPKRGMITELHKELGHSRMHISHCLKGFIETELSEKIRKRAIELGGIEVKKKQ